MAARASVGFAMLAAALAQSARSALVAQAVTLEARVPVIFFDGSARRMRRTRSAISDDQIKAAIDDDLARAPGACSHT